MEPLPVIPRPPRQKWRDFRARVLPALVFACTVLVISNVWRQHFVPREIGGATLAETTSERQRQVVTAKTLKERVLQLLAVLPGNFSSAVVAQDKK